MLRTVKRVISIFVLCCLVFSGMTFFTACEDWEFDMSFEKRCVTSEDGFVYYEDSKIGLCIIALPDSEEVIIPEFIDGKQVKQLGYKEVSIGVMETHTVDGSKVKKLTIQHSVDYVAVSFNNLNTLVYVDFLYCWLNTTGDTVRAWNSIGSIAINYESSTKVEILTSDRTLDLSNCFVKTIKLPDYVVKIDSNSFNLLSGLTIKTSHESKPDDWADGWSGDNEVIWNVDI